MGSDVLQQGECSGTNDGLRAALHSQFATEVIDVPLDRVHTQDEALGILAFGGAFQQLGQHFAIALILRFHKLFGALRVEGEI